MNRVRISAIFIFRIICILNFPSAPNPSYGLLRDSLSSVLIRPFIPLTEREKGKRRKESGVAGVILARSGRFSLESLTILSGSSCTNPTSSYLKDTSKGREIVGE